MLEEGSWMLEVYPTNVSLKVLLFYLLQSIKYLRIHVEIRQAF